MAGRRKKDREIVWVADPFRSYLRDLTPGSYLPDFFKGENYRAIIGFIVGVLFFGYGFGRMFIHPGLQSLGVMFVGFAVGLLCFVWPLLRGLAVASFKGVTGRG
ncbi:MAG TPA: hypothetical protein VN108_11720 [Marmoricola sp.]|nr:hypothetical protein [Marmoricola sp.]